MTRPHEHHDFLLPPDHVSVRRQNGERIVLIYGERTEQVSVVLACFPLAHPGRMVAFYDRNGAEIGILADVRQLDGESLEVVREELERSYFMPEIQEIRKVEKLLNVHKWEVTTDRGLRTFEIRKPKRNIRKLTRRRLLVQDVDGNRYDIPDWTELPEDSQLYLEEYT